MQNLIIEEERLLAMQAYEQEAYNEGHRLIAGIDEVGRGPIAGPVVAAAVILPPGFSIPGINDSKKIPAKKREQLAVDIKKAAWAWAVSYIYPPRLDELNIYQATQAAMQTAVLSLNIKPDLLLIDAMQLNDINIKQKSIIKGDALSISIAAASIIAKVERDNTMEYYDALFPGYGFAKHKGYATKEHVAAVFAQGPCALHRKSFEPIKTILNGGNIGGTEQPSLFK